MPNKVITLINALQTRTRRALRTLSRWLSRQGYRPERRYMRGRGAR